MEEQSVDEEYRENNPKYINSFKLMLDINRLIKAGKPYEYLVYSNILRNSDDQTKLIKQRNLIYRSFAYFKQNDLYNMNLTYNKYNTLLKSLCSIEGNDLIKISYRYIKVLNHYQIFSLSKNLITDLINNIKYYNIRIEKNNADLIEKLEKDIENDYNIYLDKTLELVKDKKIMLNDINEKSSINDDDIYYLINKEWYDKFKIYRESEYDSEKFPGQIDNIHLLNNNEYLINNNLSNNSFKIDDLGYKDDIYKGYILKEPDYLLLKNIFTSNFDVIMDKNKNIFHTKNIKIKILLINDELKNEKPYEINYKYIDVEPIITIGKLKNKLINYLEYHLGNKIDRENYDLNFYSFNLNLNHCDKSKEEYNKKLIKKIKFDLLFSYLINDSIKNFQVSNKFLTKLDYKNDDFKLKLDDYKVNKTPYIIEITKHDDSNYIEIFDENNCVYCRNQLKANIKYCHECNVKFYSFKYCSQQCYNLDENHHYFHKALFPYQHFLYNIQVLQYSNLQDYNINPNNNLKGFRNLGNTCYMNSGFQCILHCELFIKYFVSYYSDNELPSSNKSELYNSLKSLIFSIYYQTNGTSMNISNLRSSFVAIEDAYNDYYQHDSTELIADFLNCLAKEVNRNKTYQYDIINNFNDNYFLNWERSLNKTNSIVQNLFYGEINNRYICPNKNCNKVKDLIEQFLLFSLPIPKYTVNKWLLNCKFFKLNKLKFEKYKLKVNLNSNVKEIKELNPEINFNICLIKRKKTGIEFYFLNDNEKILEENDLDSFFVNNEYVLYEKYESDSIKEEDSQITFFGLFDYNRLNYKGNIIYFTDIFSIVKLDNSKKIKISKINYYPINFTVSKNESIENIQHTIYTLFGLTSESKTDKFYLSISDIQKYNNYILLSKNIKRDNMTELCMDNSIENTDQIDLYDCFEFFLNPTNYSKCDKCGETYDLKSKIRKCPYYLIIAFKRFSQVNHRFIKNNVFIQYKQYFSLRNYLFEPLDSNKKKFYSYELIGVNIHHGSLDFGHYYSNCKVNDKWYCFNDSSVSPIDEFSEDANAFILFYKRID